MRLREKRLVNFSDLTVRDAFKAYVAFRMLRWTTDVVGDVTARIVEKSTKNSVEKLNNHIEKMEKRRANAT